jgi:hypothetical protein
MLLFAACGVKRESFHMLGERFPIDIRDVLSKNCDDDFFQAFDTRAFDQHLHL